MIKTQASISIKIVIGLFLLALLGSGCSGKMAQAAAGLQVTGAYDMTPLATAVQKDFQQASGINLSINPATTSLQDLRSGKADIAILGREPSTQELQNLQDSVVGYDAVCMLISARSYNGGVEQIDNTASGGLITPEAKFAGLQNLTLDQLWNIEANLLQVNTADSHWFLPAPPLMTYQGYYDPNTSAPVVDADQPNLLQGTWVWNSVDFQGENLLPGKFDTETVLLKKLGFPETLLNNPRLSFATQYFNSEEELISARFEVLASPQMAAQTSSYSFEFFLRQASRRVTLRAIQHGFFLKALSIEGIDPLSDPKVIYNGSYPLSRKIHILTRQPAAPDAQKFVNYLLSPAGQKLIAAAQFLPLPTNP